MPCRRRLAKIRDAYSDANLAGLLCSFATTKQFIAIAHTWLPKRKLSDMSIAIAALPRIIYPGQNPRFRLAGGQLQLGQAQQKARVVHVLCATETGKVSHKRFTASKTRTEMNIIQVENRHIPMPVKAGYCRIRFEGYLGNVG
jgi:hypothetical protein